MFGVIFFVFGIFCCSIGLMFCFLYLNLLSLGYSFLQLVHFIIRRGECLLFLFGFFLLILVWKGHDIYELLLRPHTKF